MLFVANMSQKPNDVKDAKAVIYRDDFFKDDILKKLYGVEFENLAVKYE